LKSPLYRASAIRAPLLIAQGANDPRVKKRESDQIVQALKENGTEVEYLVFENDGHGLAHQENIQRFAAVAEIFLARHLGGRTEPSPDPLKNSQLNRSGPILGDTLGSSAS
jgi:dipeptidyl aminopeptidase/acylaminoacyl peptidase